MIPAPTISFLPLIAGPSLVSSRVGGIFSAMQSPLVGSFLPIFTTPRVPWFPIIFVLSVYPALFTLTIVISGSLLFFLIPQPPVFLPKSDFLLAQSALFIVCYFFSALGYCIGLSKSILLPLQKVSYLGFISVSCLHAFTLIHFKFLAFLRGILSRETVELVKLQKLAGKCISMALAVPGARFFIY